MCACASMPQHACGGQRIFLKSSFSSTFVCPEDQTKDTRLCSRLLYPLSHLTDPRLIFQNNFISPLGGMKYLIAWNTRRKEIKINRPIAFCQKWTEPGIGGNRESRSGGRKWAVLLKGLWWRHLVVGCDCLRLCFCDISLSGKALWVSLETDKETTAGHNWTQQDRIVNKQSQMGALLVILSRYCLIQLKRKGHSHGIWRISSNL